MKEDQLSTNVISPVTGSVWRVLVDVGDAVGEEQEIVIVESMKMEIPVDAGVAGVVERIHAPEGTAVTDRDVLVSIAEA